MAVCGFGAGALVTGPLDTELIGVVGVSATFWILGSVYLVVMYGASRVLRFPPLDYRPEGWKPEATSMETGKPERSYELREALRMPQFWLLWTLFFLNITAGITLISLGSLMGQEIVGMTAVQAGVMVGIMGVFNGAGRLGWSTASDYLRRPATFGIMIGAQILVFAAIPSFTSAALLQAAFFFVMTCYGGGFATCPAFIADLFGSRHAGAIYGAVLTAWSAAGVFGPTLAATIREQSESYAGALHAISGVLVVALACVIGIVVLARGQRATTA
jgi:OFA family oxalate/formate antiporter-like MFS transporter